MSIYKASPPPPPSLLTTIATFHPSSSIHNLILTNHDLMPIHRFQGKLKNSANIFGKFGVPSPVTGSQPVVA